MKPLDSHLSPATEGAKYRSSEAGRPCFSVAIRFSLAVVCFVCLWLPGSMFALDPDKDLWQYNCQTWTRQNGLPVNGINAITQTRDGYLWFGTSVGLIRFDGIEFTLLDLSRVAEVRSTLVTSLASARDQGLWVGLWNSAYGFHDGQSFSFRGKESLGQANLNVRSLMESKDGALWFAAESGVSRLTRAGTYENLLESGPFTNQPNVLCGYEDRQGRIWFGTANQGAFYWEAGKATRLHAPELDATSVLSLAEDHLGQIWIGTSIGLHCYDANFQRKEIPPLVDETRALLVDRQGVLWLGTSGRGVGRYQNGTYEFLQKTDGLAGNYVNALAEDREGSLWIGTRDGVSQLTDVKFPIHRAAEDPLIKDALAVGASQRGGIWIASPGGVTYFDGKAKTYATETGIPNRYVKRVFEAANGDVYLVSGGCNLAILSAEKAVAVYTNDNMVVGVAEDAHGVVVSVGGGLFRAGTNYFQPYEFKGGEKPEMHWILNLAAGRDGVIWVACVNGIVRVKDGEFHQWSAAQGLTDPVVQWVCEDSEGIVWGATISGIVRLKGDHVRVISRKHGLFDDNIYSIVPDELGHLWVDSSRGVFRVSRQSMNDFADGRSDHVECTAYNGLESVKTTDKTVQERVGCKSADGRIWFPSPLGVVVIDPARIPTNRIVPPVHIDRVRANGQEVVRGERIIVPPGEGELEFSFAALSFISPQTVRFRYRLEGYDHEWVEAGDRRMAFYTNLKPGKYTFRVIAANADGIWNESGDQLGLELRPRFSQTAWFDLLCGGGVAGALAGAVLWRLRRLKRGQLALQENRDRLEAEVRNRTAQLAQANISLEREIGEHKYTAVELRERTQSLEKEIEERKQMQSEVERVHSQLLEISRQAGMAEVATSVLHNVGNVLNSVNTSASVVADRLQASKAEGVARVAELLDQNRHDLPGFFSAAGRTDQLINFLRALAQHLASERKISLGELAELTNHIGHIKEIVAMQQSYARVSGLTESVHVLELVEDALRMNGGALARHEVQLIRDYPVHLPPITVDKHKVLQVLVNLIRNARHACDDSGQSDKRLTLRVTNGDNRVRIAVVDNGVGIPPENLTRIFSHGFTTRKNGHGFGLHSGALAARELGGSLTAHSEGPGRGATFTLELPARPKCEAHGAEKPLVSTTDYQL